MSENTATDVKISQETITALEAYLPFWQVYKTVSDEGNAIRREFLAASKSQGDVVETLLNESDDAKIVEWRKFDEAITAKIMELTQKRDDAKAQAKAHAESLVPSVSEVDTDALKASYLDKRKAANLTGKNILALLGSDEALFKTGLDYFGIVEVVGLSGNAQSKGATGIVRKRLESATIDGSSVADSKGKVSFTTLSQRLKVDGDVIRTEAAKAAGVDSVKDIPDSTTVDFKIVSDGKTHEVSITTPGEDN